jgi:chorismate lyase/3-hydroxybenzoate synthase
MTNGVRRLVKVTCRYGSAEAVPHEASLLGVVRFGGRASIDGHTPSISIPMAALADGRDAELWVASGPVRKESFGKVSTAATDDVLFGAITAEPGASLVDATRTAYQEVVSAARAAGYPNLLRVWNHVSGINDDSSGLERYKEFSRGRAEALERLGYRLGDDLPAASAVGSGGDGVRIYFLSARAAGQQVENPRQVSAYCYPERYGPRSPSFARATLVPWGEGQTLFVSGTASIVGHETVHEGDVQAQLEETLRNMQTILGKVGIDSLAAFSAVKVYLRSADHLPILRDRIAAAFGGDEKVLYLEADICRRELLVEIEGVAQA